MKKILQINTVVNFGSTGHIVEAIGDQILKRGWESYIAYGRKTRPSHSKLIKVGGRISILYHYVQREFFDRSGLASVISTKKLIKNIGKIKPDLIHLHNLHGCYLNIKLLLEYLSTLKIPIVFTLHDCWSMTGHCAYFTMVKCDKWKTMCNSCPQLRLEKYWPFIIDNSRNNFILKKQLFSKLTNLTLVPVSFWLESVVKESFLNTHNIKMIYNGIDTSVFYFREDCCEVKEKYNLLGKRILLGVANIWEDRKGLKDFYSLSTKISSDYIIVLVGLTKKQIKQLPPNIVGIERTESVDELARFYSIADLFINPSVEETFGLTTIEALACGTPVVVYNSTASPELVTSETGFIVDVHDIDSILEAINVVNKNGKVKYLSPCRERVVNLFTQEKQCKEYLKLYDELFSRI